MRVLIGFILLGVTAVSTIPPSLNETENSRRIQNSENEEDLDKVVQKLIEAEKRNNFEVLEEGKEWGAHSSTIDPDVDVESSKARTKRRNRSRKRRKGFIRKTMKPKMKRVGARDEGKEKYVVEEFIGDDFEKIAKKGNILSHYIKKLKMLRKKLRKRKERFSNSCPLGKVFLRDCNVCFCDHSTGQVECTLQSCPPRNEKLLNYISLINNCNVCAASPYVESRYCTMIDCS